MKEIHKPYICLIYGKWYQHIFRYCLLVNINGYHHIIWKRVSSYALLCCGIVENVCTLVRGEEGPRVPIPSLQTIKCSFLNFSILEGYWLCIGVVLTTLVNEMVPEWAQESDHNINSAYRVYLLVSSYLLSNTSQRIVCINDLTWTSSTCVIIPLSYMIWCGIDENLSLEIFIRILIVQAKHDAWLAPLLTRMLGGKKRHLFISDMGLVVGI